MFLARQKMCILHTLLYPGRTKDLLPARNYYAGPCIQPECHDY
jgi:hypothetical protein